MSLEKALQENTEALKALTAAMGSEAPTETKVAPKKDKKSTAKTEEKKADKEDDKPAYESKKYLNEVKPLTLKVIKAKDRDAVADVLAHFGDDLKSAKDLTADQYDEYMEKLNEILEDEDLA